MISLLLKEKKKQTTGFQCMMHSVTLCHHTQTCPTPSFLAFIVVAIRIKASDWSTKTMFAQQWIQVEVPTPSCPQLEGCVQSSWRQEKGKRERTRFLSSTVPLSAFSPGALPPAPLLQDHRLCWQSMVALLALCSPTEMRRFGDPGAAKRGSQHLLHFKNKFLVGYNFNGNDKEDDEIKASHWMAM